MESTFTSKNFLWHIVNDIREVLTFVDWCSCETHTNFADELICLLGDNVWIEEVTIHRSQEVLKMLSLLIAD